MTGPCARVRARPARGSSSRTGRPAIPGWCTLKLGGRPELGGRALRMSATWMSRSRWPCTGTGARAARPRRARSCTRSGSSTPGRSRPATPQPAPGRRRARGPPGWARAVAARRGRPPAGRVPRRPRRGTRRRRPWWRRSRSWGCPRRGAGRARGACAAWTSSRSTASCRPFGAGLLPARAGKAGAAELTKGLARVL